jgi:hypothetical protein
VAASKVFRTGEQRFFGVGHRRLFRAQKK